MGYDRGHTDVSWCLTGKTQRILSFYDHSRVDPAEEHYTINTDQTNPSCSLSIPRRKPNAATFPHNLKPSRNDPSDVLVGQASISSGTSKVHSMPSHLGTQAARKQCPLLRPSQENRSTQSNVPPWFGNQEPRTMPLPKRPHAQKKNEPVQFFERSLLEVEAQGPPGQSRPLVEFTQISERSRTTLPSKPTPHIPINSLRAF